MGDSKFAKKKQKGEKISKGSFEDLRKKGVKGRPKKSIRLVESEPK